MGKYSSASIRYTRGLLESTTWKTLRSNPCEILPQVQITDHFSFALMTTSLTVTKNLGKNIYIYDSTSSNKCTIKTYFMENLIKLI